MRFEKRVIIKIGVLAVCGFVLLSVLGCQGRQDRRQPKKRVVFVRYQSSIPGRPVFERPQGWQRIKDDDPNSVLFDGSRETGAPSIALTVVSLPKPRELEDKQALAQRLAEAGRKVVGEEEEQLWQREITIENMSGIETAIRWRDPTQDRSLPKAWEVSVASLFVRRERIYAVEFAGDATSFLLYYEVYKQAVETIRFD